MHPEVLHLAGASLNTSFPVGPRACAVAAAHPDRAGVGYFGDRWVSVGDASYRTSTKTGFIGFSHVQGS